MQPTNLSKSVLLRSVAILSSGSVIAQAIVFISSPVLTRIYSAEDFGKFAIFTAVVGTLGMFGCLRYETAIPLAKDEETAKRLLCLCAVLVATMTCISTGVVILFGKSLLELLNIPELAPWLWLIPLGIFLTSSQMVISSWATRRKKFKAMATTEVTQKVISVSIQIFLGIFRNNYTSLVFGNLFGLFSSAILLLYTTMDRNIRRSDMERFSDVVNVAKKFKRYPSYLLFSNFLNVAGRQLPIFILAGFYDPTVTGLFALSQRVLQTPMTFLGINVRTVVRGSVEEARRKGELPELIDNFFQNLLRVGLPLMLIFMAAAPEIFSLFFGPSWRQAGVYSQSLMPWLLLVFVTSPLSSLPLVLDRQRGEMVFQAVLFSVRLIALLLGGLLLDATWTVAIFGLSSAICWMFYMFWILRLIGRGIKTVALRLLRECLVIAPFVVPAFATAFFYDAPNREYVQVTVAALCFVGVVVFLVVRFRRWQ